MWGMPGPPCKGAFADFVGIPNVLALRRLCCVMGTLRMGVTRCRGGSR